MKDYNLAKRFVLIILILLALALYIYEGKGDSPKTDPGNAPPAMEQVIEKTLPESEMFGDPIDENNAHSYRTITYGYSGNRVPLKAYQFTCNNGNRKILCVFAIHGCEDAFYRDGQALVDTALEIVEHYKNNSSSLGSYDLVIVSEANPDGVRQGWTCNGPGRCQISQGIDINMDFDYNFRVRTNPRNKTGSEPFSSPEAVALRNLVANENPDIIIDFHGWINCAAGDTDLVKVFCRHLGLVNKVQEHAIYDGFFIGWAAKFSKAVLVEYPNPFTGQGDYKGKSDQKYDYIGEGFSELGYTEKTIKAIDEIVEKQL